jgi:hypothetical protein
LWFGVQGKGGGVGIELDPLPKSNSLPGIERCRNMDTKAHCDEDLCQKRGTFLGNWGHGLP